MQTAAPPIFVFHPQQPAPGVPSVRCQLDALSLAYTPVQLLSNPECTPGTLAEKYGEHIFSLANNPYREMSVAVMARLLAYCQAFQRMEEQGIELACFLEEELELGEDFPALLQAPGILQGTWDILVLEGADPDARLALHWRKFLRFQHFRTTRLLRLPSAVPGCLVRRPAARVLRSLALPLRAPLTRCLGDDAYRYGVRLATLRPAVLCAAETRSGQELQPAGDAEATWNDFLAANYSAEYVRFLQDHVFVPMPGLRARLRKLFLGLPGIGALYRRIEAAQEWLKHRGPSRERPRSLPDHPSPAPPLETGAADPWKVAVIIPLFNREAFILPVLQNLAQQTRAPQCLVVVDDGSTDDSTRVVQEYFDRADLPFRAELVRCPENRGAAAARNRGLAHIDDCDFVYFLDSDDFPHRDFLRRAVPRLAQEPDAIALSGDRIMQEGVSTRFASSHKLPENPVSWFLLQGAGIASATLFRRSALERAGSFNENLPTGHDTDLFHRLALQGKWLYLPGAPVAILRFPDQDNLFKYYASDFKLKWTYIWENNWHRLGGRRHLASLMRHRFATAWYESGEQLHRQKQFVRANECFRRSLACQFSLRALLHLKAPGLPSVPLLARAGLRFLSHQFLQRLAPVVEDAGTTALVRGTKTRPVRRPSTTVPPPIFVFHPQQSLDGGPSTRCQLESFSLEYTPVPTHGDTPLALAGTYGAHIFCPAGNPYRAMSPDDVARVPAHCQVFQRMEEQNIKLACLLEEGLTLGEDFPALLQTPEVLHGNWDVLVLGSTDPGPRAAWLRRKTRLYKGFRMARPMHLPYPVRGYLVRRPAARILRALALPVQAPLGQCLEDANRCGVRLRFLQPAVLSPPSREAAPNRETLPAQKARTAWNDFLAAVYSPEYVHLLKDTSAWSRHQRLFPLYFLRHHLLDFLQTIRLRGALQACMVRLGLVSRRPSPAPDPGMPRQQHATPDTDALRVTVILPLFNREQFVIPVIKNLERQTRAPQHLIVVDDGSSDNSARMVQEYFAGNHQLPFTAELLRQEQNHGVSAARNRGLLHAADCDFIYFLDSDDFPPRDFLHRAVSHLAREPGAIAASCDQVFWGRNRAYRLRNTRLQKNPHLDFLLYGAGIASVTLFRRSVFRRAGWFNENLPTGEDTDLFDRLARCGEWLHLPGAPGIMSHLRGGLSRNERLISWRIWSYVWENNLYCRDGAQHIPDSAKRDRLAQTWFHSGIILCRKKFFEEAAECFRRSLAYRFSAMPLLYLMRPPSRRRGLGIGGGGGGGGESVSQPVSRLRPHTEAAYRW